MVTVDSKEEVKNSFCPSIHFMIISNNPLPPYLSTTDNTSGNNTTNDNNNNNNAIDKDNASVDNDDSNGDKESWTMAKTAAATKKAPAAATKEAGAKKTGEDIINIDSPPRKKQRAANQAASYFSTMTLKGYMVNPYSMRSKNMIDVVFHKGGVPPEYGKPVMLLDLRGKALRVK